MPQSFPYEWNFLPRAWRRSPAAAGATGYGIIESDGRNCRMLRFGALRATRKGPEHFPERLREIHTMLSDLIEEFQPHGVAVESVFTALNIKTALRLAEVRGVVPFWRRHSARFQFPAIRRARGEGLCGRLRARGQTADAAHGASAASSMTETPEPADAADAAGRCAVATCRRLNFARGRSPEPSRQP